MDYLDLEAPGLTAGNVEKIAALFAATELWEGALSCSKNQEPLNAKARKKGIRAGRSERTARPIC